ncbi:DUF2461 domain-containing protein [Flavobacterium phragmitis]|uniref:Cell-wall binding lipoprotein n=1 Tax=Flavobacterium phragmitis TaxID=739143 RepID=A0A1I1WVV8_9FLAO|nr:DUF2461 domain-containing protein [Flavobacterium phragmitis]SFD99179.1 hypothetical protein SAMN05216297_11767 [Flavobacterium phragmitis]
MAVFQLQTNKTIMMMRLNISITVLLIITMSSCKSSKATDFMELLDQSERRAFAIVVGKNGSGEKKLEYLEKDDFKGAAMAVDQQAVEFDKLITDIKKLSTDGIQEGEQLKTASIEYYKALKELHIFDKKEIEQQALLQTVKNDELKNVQNKLMVLLQQKKALYNSVYEKEAFLNSASEAFKVANGL